tara:strand:+ start:169 stop:489 length:321 start_codon:yes stop_codon:yes gene_type:complete
MINLFYSNRNIGLIRSIFFRTCIFFIGAYFVFHFLNGNISLNPLQDKKELIQKNLIILEIKEKELAYKELLINKLNNVHDNLELLDELTRLKLGYSSQDEVVLSIK